MDESQNGGAFVTNTRWVDKVGESLVFACSDGRFHDSRVEFLRIGREARRPDALLWPGGPAAFLVTAPWFFAVKAQVEFLAREHDLSRILAVAHHDCLYYRRKYPSSNDTDRATLQENDLRRFRTEAARIKSGLKIELYYEEPSGETIHYRKVS